MDDSLTQARAARTVLTGTSCCVFGLFAFALQDSIVKGLSESYPVLQILTLRTYVVLVVIVLVAVAMGGSRLLKTSRPLPLLARGCFAFSAFTLYYLALTQMAFADGAAIYMSAPLFVTALSVPILGERVGLHRWLAIGVGFTAAVYMINPGASVFQAAAVLPLASAALYAFIPILNRYVGMREHALTMALYSIIAYAVLCTIAGLAVLFLAPERGVDGLLGNLVAPWRTPTPGDFVQMAASGLIFVVGLLCLTQAYRLLPVSIVAPFEYSYIVWAALLGFLFFAEIPGHRTLLGASIIVAAGCYIAFRERRLARG